MRTTCNSGMPGRCCVRQASGNGQLLHLTELEPNIQPTSSSIQETTCEASGRGGQINRVLSRIRRPLGLGRMAGLASVILFPSAIHLVAVPAWAGQAEEIVAETGLPDMTEAALPEAPEPQLPAASLEPRRKPCTAKSKTDATS